MFDDEALLEKLRKIEALHAGATTDGERNAAAFAAEKIRERLANFRKQVRDIEMQYSIPDPWKRMLFVALCRRYGLTPFRHRRQRASTVCVEAPEQFQRETLWPQFLSLGQALSTHLNEITQRVINVAIHADSSDAKEVRELPPG